MDTPSGTVLQVPSPGLATVGSHRGLISWGCLRATGTQGWAEAGAKGGQGAPTQGKAQPGSPPASSTVPYVPALHLGWAVIALFLHPGTERRSPGGYLPTSRFGMEGPANTLALKFHSGHSLAVGCR